MKQQWKLKTNLKINLKNILLLKIKTMMDLLFMPNLKKIKEKKLRDIKQYKVDYLLKVV